MADLTALFQSLASLPTRDAIAASRVPSMPKVWIGKDDQQMPVVIVQTEFAQPMPSALVLRNLRFDPYIECIIEEPPRAKRHTIHASLIRVTTPEPELHAYFFRAIAPLLGEVSKAPHVTELAHAINRLAEIFRALALPPASSLQGLWTEMLLISQASAIDYSVRAWHPTKRSLFDFDAGTEAVEVKSSATGIRKHHFKLAQVRPPSNRRIYVFSMLLTPSQSGPSILDLWASIEDRLTAYPQLGSRLAEVIAQSAGADWRHADGVRYDDSSAISSLLIFEATAIPQVPDPENPDITDIEFDADLSSTPSVPINGISDAQMMLKALVPQTVFRRYR